ncbi:S26 family signal peptidase [Myxococcota bacterium]|nr:S26 family signal peptidase [Myxococcota bacterium]MBU1382491.1 S26 family signal peptidase [Myxococcota bacterium]MBU1497947.1 S26 family signal peptidase [Myxococcota bacterium]
MNFRYFKVVSGSMNPALKIGDIVAVIASRKYKAGSVVVFKRGGYCVHRIHVNLPFFKIILEKGDASPHVTVVKYRDIIGVVEMPNVAVSVNFITQLNRIISLGISKLVRFQKSGSVSSFSSNKFNYSALAQRSAEA